MALILSGGNGGNATITGNSGNLTISNAANIFTGSAVVSTTGNVTGGNLFTAGIMSSTGNITGSNILTAGLISSTGNISAGNTSAVRGKKRTRCQVMVYPPSHNAIATTGKL